MHTLDIVQVVAFVVAFAAQTSRLLVASRAFWSRLPAWAQTLLPVLVPTLATLAQGLTGVHTWSDLSVQFVVCAGLLLPGLPSNRSAAPLQAGKPATLSASAGDMAVASAVKMGSIAPPAKKSNSGFPMGPMGGTRALCIVLSLSTSLTGCAWFDSKLPKAETCLPTPAALAGQVAMILADGGDYVAALEALAVTDDGENVIKCAVEAFMSAQKTGASEAGAASHERAQHYLDLKAAK